MNSPQIKLLGIDFGHPFDIATFSGSSYYLWTELKKRGALADAFTPYPSPAVTAIYKLLSFRPSIVKWRAHWRRSLPFRRLLSSRAADYIRKQPTNTFDATLQIGAYYNVAPAWSGVKALLADNNCVISQATNVTFQSSERIFRRQFEFEKDVYNSMDLVFAFSRFLADSFINDFGCDPENVKVVHAGINLDETQIRDDNKDYSKRVVMFSGFNFENKGGYVLLDAFERVIKRIPEAKLVLVGPSVTGLPDYVQNLGPLSKDNPEEMSKLAECYRSASVFVLPTFADAFPNVLREAMAARLPCIASDTGAIPEIVAHEETGFLVPMKDPLALADRLIELLSDPERCRKMGEAGYARYQSSFTWKSVCDRMLAAIAGRLDPKWDRPAG